MSIPSAGGTGAVVWCSATLTNGADLAGALGLTSDAGDAQIVAAAVARWGSQAQARLLGAWGYAVRAGADLVVVRDALGTMPVYWARTPMGPVATDSLVEAIESTGSAEPDDVFAWATQARALDTVPERTPAAAVHRVPPGCSVRISAEGHTVTRWWRPEDVPPVGRVSVGEAAASLRELLLTVIDEHASAALRDAAERRTTEAGGSGLGAHLSGGLDSTTVALLAERALEQRGLSLQAVASWSPHPDEVGFDGSLLPYDERQLVSDLAAEHGIPVLFGPADLGEADWLAAIDPVHQPRSTLSRESRLLPLWMGAGVRVVFSGWGGDEFVSFNGRRTNRALVRGLRVGPVVAAYRELRARGRGARGAVSELVADALPDRWRPDALRGVQEEPRTSDRFVADTGWQHPDLVSLREAHRHLLRDAASPRELQLALLTHDHLARRVESWHEAGRRFGVEYRYPLLDVRLVEWALSMPPEVYRLGGHTRRVFRLALEGLVTDHVRMTSKDDPVLLDLVRRTHPDSALSDDG